jgi:hypothetical protein
MTYGKGYGKCVLAAVSVPHFYLQLHFETLLEPINFNSDTLEMRAETHVVLHIKGGLFFV